jgi:SAM-dependent methyltransferase
MPYDPLLYQGAAAHYRRGRPPYSADLESSLADELGLDGTGRLLDGGCGPGILTVRLAHLFEEAVGLDPDAEMLAEARRAAGERGVTGIRWVRARAEELPDAAPGPYRLVTFGQSFQWTDGPRVAAAVYDVLEPGGALVLIAHTASGRPEPPSTATSSSPPIPPIPHDDIEALVERYLGSTRRAQRGTDASRTRGFEDVLRGSRFGPPRVWFLPGVANLVRDSESVLAGYLSLSWCTPRLFGDRLDDFADEMRDLLKRRSADGLFRDWPGDTEIVLARKPDSAVRSRTRDQGA